MTTTRDPEATATAVSGPGADTTVPEPSDADGTQPEASGAGHQGASFGRFVVRGRLGEGGMGVVLSGYDPELDRKVALKLLHSTGATSEAARARLQREAKAMARLAHPNTVTVYEVGPAGDQLFIAMELVDGTTLRAWIAERERPWREVLAMFIAAGRGLEAAHAAGLVHRDFKPDNVLIGKDGRPRVSDFGLAASGVPVGDPEVERGSLDASLSVHGVAVGTPAYMAPEQWLGGEVDARTDQFAFCVSLWYALWGKPPFIGGSRAALRDAVLEGRRAPPGERSGLPGWLGPVLDRGLEHDREKRWPSMGALLGELERRANARRRAWIGVGAGGLVAIAAAALFVVETRPDPPEVCAAPRERIDTVWSAARRTALGQHLATIDPTLGPARFTAAAAVLDRNLPAWSAMHIATCRANRVEHTRSDTAYEAQQKCLGNWLEGAASLVTSLEQAGSPAQLDAAIKGVGSVAPLDDCENVERLLKAEPRLELPAERAAHAELLVEMKQIEGEIKAKRFAGLIERADQVLARARKLDQPWTTAAALWTRCRVAGEASDYTNARACWTELTEVAARAGDDQTAAMAWLHLAIDQAGHDGRFDEAKVMVAAARAVVARAGNPPMMRANVLTTEAQVLTDAKDFAAARPLLAEAQRLLIAEGADQAGSTLGPELADVTRTIGHLEWLSGNLDAAVAAWKDAIAQFDRALGPDTLYSATVYIELAQVLHMQQKEDEADAAIARVVQIREHAGTEQGLATALGLQAQIMSARRPADAVAISERALAIARRAWPETSTARLGVAGMHALNLKRAKRNKEALALYEEIVAIVEREHLVTTNAVIWTTTRAQLVHELGDDCSAALPLYKRALELATAARADGHYHATALRGEGLCLHALGRDVEAIDRFERSLAVPNKPGREKYDSDVSFIRAKLGTLLYDTGRDRIRGLTLARAGLAELHGASEVGPDVDALDAWFKRRRLSPDGK